MSILDEADSIVNGDRAVAYGPAERNLSRIAAMWSAYLGHDVDARQVAMCMALLKIGRDAHKPKRDNLVDLAGYAELADQIGHITTWTATDRNGQEWWRDDDGTWWKVGGFGPSDPTVGDSGLSYANLARLYGPLVEETR